MVIGLMLFIANAVTRQTIASNEQQRFNAALTEVLPDTKFDNNLRTSSITLADEHQQKTRTVYRGWSKNLPAVAVISTYAADGYSGRIDMLIGVTYDSQVSGVRVLRHSETPGLGDDIEIRKSDWILSFDGTSLDSGLRWQVKRDGGDFDQFTGATITPRAIVKEVKHTVEWFDRNKRRIFHSQ
jgi:electron transport complex protein RnfG